MTTATQQIIMCDHDEGSCDQYVEDFWDQCVSTVGGVKITRQAPAPGWIRLPDGTDLCVEHRRELLAMSWVDKQGDVWRFGDDGLMHTPETAPFSREHVEKKWGPLRLIPDPTSTEETTP